MDKWNKRVVIEDSSTEDQYLVKCVILGKLVKIEFKTLTGARRYIEDLATKLMDINSIELEHIRMKKTTIEIHSRITRD